MCSLACIIAGCFLFVLDKVCDFGPKLRSLLKQKILRLVQDISCVIVLTRRQNLARYIQSLCFRTYHFVSQPVTLFHNLSPCFRTRHSVSEPVSLFHNLSLCFTTVTLFHNPSLCFTTCHSVSEPVTLFQNLSLCFRTCHSVSDQKAGLQMWT